MNWPTSCFQPVICDDCEKVCRKCLELDAQYVSAHVILGMIALRRNQDEQARQILTQAVAMEPDNPFALNELAYLNHLQGDDDTAMELVNRALEESPEYADALCNKGVILYFRSEFEQSVAAFRPNAETGARSCVGLGRQGQHADPAVRI